MYHLLAVDLEGCNLAVGVAWKMTPQFACTEKVARPLLRGAPRSLAAWRSSYDDDYSTA